MSEQTQEVLIYAGIGGGRGTEDNEVMKRLLAWLFGPKMYT